MAEHLIAPDAPSLAEAFTGGIGDLLKAAVPAAEDVRRARNDSALIALKKPEAALAYRKIYADAVATATEGAPDFVEHIQLATAEYNARMMAILPENLRGPMLSYLEDLQISTVQSADSFQTASDIALRARQADDAARAWIDLAKEDSTLLPQIREQIRDFVTGQQLDPKAADGLEQALADHVTGAALMSDAATKPEQFLANKASDRWTGVDPERLSLAAAQAAQVLELKKHQATAEAETRPVGLQVRVQYAVECYQGGADFPGYAALAQALRTAGKTELLQNLDESRSDLGYATAQQSSTPELLEKSRNDNLARAEAAKDPQLAKMYRRHAAIDEAAQRAVAGGVRSDPLTFAVRAAVVEPTEVLAPLFETATTGDMAALSNAVADRVAARKQVERHYGAPVGFLTPQERQKFVTNYAALPGARERFDLLRTLDKLPDAITTEIGDELSPLADGNEVPLVLDIIRDDPAQAYDVIYGLGIIRRYPTIIAEKSGRFGFALDERFKKSPPADRETLHNERTAVTALYAAMSYNLRGASKVNQVRNDLLDIAFARVTQGRAPPQDHPS
jgi:hypothetical protein